MTPVPTWQPPPPPQPATGPPAGRNQPPAGRRKVALIAVDWLWALAPTTPAAHAGAAHAEPRCTAGSRPVHGQSDEKAARGSAQDSGTARIDCGTNSPMGLSLEIASSSYPQPFARQKCALADPCSALVCPGLFFDPTLAASRGVHRL